MKIRYVGANAARRPSPAHLPAPHGVTVEVDDELGDELVASADWELAGPKSPKKSAGKAAEQPEEGN